MGGGGGVRVGMCGVCVAGLYGCVVRSCGVGGGGGERWGLVWGRGRSNMG